MVFQARYDLVLRSRRTCLPGGAGPAAVCVTSGKIAAVLPYDAPVPAGADRDLGELALLPGLVDAHVHAGEPGHTEEEGFAQATGAAARRGITTLIDLPVGSVAPTVSAAALAARRDAAKGQCFADVGFWGAAVPGGEAGFAALHEAGVFGFACFLGDRGQPRFPALASAELERVAGRVAELGALLVVHSDDDAVPAVLDVARRSGVRLHLPGVSSAAALPLIAAAKAEGVAVTVETAPGDLVRADADACAPVRSAADRDLLWEALGSGLIDFVASGHGAQAGRLGLAQVWAEARARGWELEQLVERMAALPARFAALPHKGRIEVACDADLVAFDPQAHQPTAEPGAQEGGAPTGAVRDVYARGWLLGGKPHGGVLRRIGTVAPAPRGAASPR